MVNPETNPDFAMLLCSLLRSQIINRKDFRGDFPLKSIDYEV